MNTSSLRLCVLCLAPALLGCEHEAGPPAGGPGAAVVRQETLPPPVKENALKIHYLEIVTPKVDETCDALANAHGVTFGVSVAELGNARTATLEGGGVIGVRAPMRPDEAPVIRPYVKVTDIHAAIKAAEAAGAVVALPPMPIPGQGTVAIYILGGIDHGLWQQEARGHAAPHEGS